MNLDSVMISCQLLSASLANIQFRIDVHDLTESTLRQLMFDETPDRVTSGQADFLVPDLVADFRYRMTIFAVDRRSLATSRPVILDVQIKEAKDDESATTTTTSATTTPTTGARPSAVATATTHKSEESLKVKQQQQQHDYSTTIYKTTFTENIIIKNYDGPDSGNLNVSEASQTLSVLGIMCGTVGAIVLLSVLFFVLKRNRRLPNVVRGSNPQTPTHVSFSANVDNPPPEIKMHRKNIDKSFGEISASETDKLNDVHFEGFPEICSELKRKSVHMEYGQNPINVRTSVTYEVPVGSLCIIDDQWSFDKLANSSEEEDPERKKLLSEESSTDLLIPTSVQPN